MVTQSPPPPLLLPKALLLFSLCSSLSFPLIVAAADDNTQQRRRARPQQQHYYALSAALATFVALVAAALYLLSPPRRTTTTNTSNKKQRKKATVVVLGDFGRSPRMQYHALSLLTQAGFDVDVISHAGGRPPAPALLSFVRPDKSSDATDANADSPRLRLIPLPNTPPKKTEQQSALLYLLRLPSRVVRSFFALLHALLLTDAHKTNHTTHLILLQTPPAPPAMTACWLAARLRGAALVVDWHNLGHTLLALRLSAGHPATRAYRLYEHAAGALADAHLCVTREMAAHLRRAGVVRDGGGGGRCAVLYDRPAAAFRRSTPREARALFARLAPQLRGGSVVEEEEEEEDFLSPTTEEDESDAKTRWRASRPALVVSSTSWTPDEDLGMLLEAARLYERLYERQQQDSVRHHQKGVDKPNAATARTPPPPTKTFALPRLLLVVTGEGPMRGAFEAEAKRLVASNELGRGVRVATAWLEAPDYPLLLGCADLGVSMHASSSGIDLPMKAVDMLGAGAPVAALHYPCVEELVPAGVRGVHFGDARGLAAELARLLAGFDGAAAGGGTPLLRALAEGAREWAQVRWEDEWAREALPLLRPLAGARGATPAA